MDLKTHIQKLKQVPIKAQDTLTRAQKQTIKELIKAAKIMDELFLTQVYSKNQELKHTLKDDELELFTIHFGPFDRLNHHNSFIQNHAKPKGANYYDEDITKEEIENHVKQHPQDEKEFTSPHTIIRRRQGKLTAIPYSKEYKTQLEQAATHLKKAAEITENNSLKEFLEKRAESFLTNDYFESELAWLDVDSKIDVTIGPYEVYEDELLGYKAGFEALIGLKDDKESKNLELIKTHIPELEQNLPMHDNHKNDHKDKACPIVVVNELFVAGDGKAGVQFTAFNLPNDEKVKHVKGSKKVLLKNVAQAKYENCWIPIADEIMHKDVLENVSFNAYFTHVLLHEIAHALGPQIITQNNTQTTVSKALKETYPTIEEAKADILGLYNMLYLVDNGFYEKTFEKEMINTFVTGFFRSIRFGIGEAHGGANIIIYNYFKEKGMVAFKNGKCTVNQEHARQIIHDLAKEILLIQAHGNYQEAKQFINTYKFMPDEVKDAIHRVKHVPVDIRPVFDLKEYEE